MFDLDFFQEVRNFQPWMKNSKCANDTKLVQWQRKHHLDFFDERGPNRDAAKAYCEDCPIRLLCLDHALQNDDLYGIWGGTTRRERRTMKSKARKAALAFLKRQQVLPPDGTDPIAS